jgi:hypothetical protein
MSDILGRIENAEDAVNHPLLLLGIFAEMERERQVELVERSLDDLLSKVLQFGNQQEISINSTIEQGHYSIDIWLKISHIRSGLENWKVQLLKLITHCDELSETYFADPFFNGNDAIVMNMAPEQAAGNLKRLRRTGQRIKERLLEIIAEYDEKIRDCTMIMDGMTLATQLVSTLCLIQYSK